MSRKLFLSLAVLAFLCSAIALYALSGSTPTNCYPPLSLVTTSIPSGTAGSSYSIALAATGGQPPYTWSFGQSSLPSGFSISSSGDVTGTPQTSGTYTFNVVVSDSLKSNVTGELALIVAASPTGTTGTTGTGTTGTTGTGTTGTTGTGTTGTTGTGTTGTTGTGTTGTTGTGTTGTTGTGTTGTTGTGTTGTTGTGTTGTTGTGTTGTTGTGTTGTTGTGTTGTTGTGTTGTTGTGTTGTTGTGTPPPPPPPPTPQAAQPTFSPAAGSVSNPTTVTASTSTTACSSHIYLGTSNPPTTNQSTYSVTTAVALYAYVHGCPGYQDSSVGNASYTIAAVTGATPVLGPFATTGQVGNAAWYPANSTLNFQYQSPNTASWAVPISISNCSNSYNSQCAGSGSLTVTGITITGANASDFTLGGTTTGTLSTGQYLSPTVTFTPSASSGTAETATLTVNYAGAAVSSQSMTLEGTSQNMTMLSSSACPTALASGTKYQLAANITCPNTVFTEGSNTNTVLNLAGYTITYCSTPSSSLAAAVLMSGNSQNLHVYGGHIVEPTGNLCTGKTSGSSYTYGSGWVINSSDGSSSGSFGTQLSLLTGSLNDGGGKVLYEESGNTSTALSTSVTMVNYQDNSQYSCNSVGCRAGDQDYPIFVDGSTKAAPTIFEMIGGVGGTQGATVTSAPKSIWEYNTLNPGSTVATTSNGFAIQDWATGATIAYNQVMTSPGVPCISCRGIQIGSINTPVTGSQIHDNYILVTQLANDAEYSGCQGGGGYGIQLNTAGSGMDLSNNIIEHNTVIATDNACPGPAFSFSNATNANGPNQSIDNHFECDLTSSSSKTYPCQGMQFLAHEYSPAPDGSFVSTGDTILGDTSAFDIAWDGTSSWTCTNCTFGPGKNPVSGGALFLDYDNGGGSSTTYGGSSPFTIVGPTFTGGMTSAQNNLASLATNNPSGLSFYYLVQWPYTVTVEKSSTGAPISGATVVATDKNSTVECSTTTNGSGVASCTLSGAKYAAASGSFNTSNYNPFAIAISYGGCTTDNYSLTITSPTTATIQLGGC